MQRGIISPDGVQGTAGMGRCEIPMRSSHAGPIGRSPVGGYDKAMSFIGKQRISATKYPYPKGSPWQGTVQPPRLAKA
jgi:hypothetical protein